MNTRLTLDEAQARVQQARAGDSATLSPEEPARPVAVPSLPTCLDIAERLIEDASDASNKWPLGIHEIDDALGGGLKKQEAIRMTGRGTARDRISMLLDEDSFIEIDTFVTHRTVEHEMFLHHNAKLPEMLAHQSA